MNLWGYYKPIAYASLVMFVMVNRMSYLTVDTQFIVSIMVFFYFRIKEEVKQND